MIHTQCKNIFLMRYVVFIIQLVDCFALIHWCMCIHIDYVWSCMTSFWFKYYITFHEQLHNVIVIPLICETFDR